MAAKKKVTIGALRPQRRGDGEALVAAPSRTRARVSERAPAPSPAPAPMRAPSPYVVGGEGPRGQAAACEEDDVVENLMASASRMTAEQRRDLLARLSLAESGMAGRERDQDMWAGAVHAALLDVAGAGDGAVLGPMAVKRLVAAPKAFAPVAAFMAATKLDRLTVQERQSFYGLLARLLVGHASEVSARSGAPMSARLVTQCGANVAAVFNQSFPGYAAAGLAHVVARRLTRARGPQGE